MAPRKWYQFRRNLHLANGPSEPAAPLGLQAALRDQATARWARGTRRRPRAQAYPKEVSRRATASRTKDITEKPKRESCWIALRSSTSA